MIHYKKILDNFRQFDLFLSRLSPRQKEIATSLKMMYAIHAENSNAHKTTNHLKQAIRFILKFLSVPLCNATIEGVKEKKKYAVLENSSIEESLSRERSIPLLKIKTKLGFNAKAGIVYRELFEMLFILMTSKELSQRSLHLLLHRLIDYLIVYHTVKVARLETLFIENDRHPENLALIHFLRKEGRVKTVKYDNWLIDPIHHNDVYCDYYFYPSKYHKEIIEYAPANRNLKYIEGGFLIWDGLSKYLYAPKKNETVVLYFTQFGVEKSEHLQYIHDIVSALEEREEPYTLMIKVHPRESLKTYQNIMALSRHIKIVKEVEDIYQLIAESNFCFSVFSTLSLEAKHIMKHSYFINYDRSFELLDYDALRLDVVQDKQRVRDILGGRYEPIAQKEFIGESNCAYPYSLKKLLETVW